MKLIVANKKSIHGVGKIAVWEIGYSVCLDLFKLVSKFPVNEDNGLSLQIKRIATSLPLKLSRINSYKKHCLKILKSIRQSLKELDILILLAYDLEYIRKEEYLQIHSDITSFSEKLLKYSMYIYKKK